MSISDLMQYIDAVTSATISQFREVLSDYGLLVQDQDGDFVVVDDTDTVDHLDGCAVVVLPRGFGRSDSGG